MGKASSPRKVGDKEALAVATTLRGSAYKLNLVAGLIRGRKASEALNILQFSTKGFAPDVRKVLASAIANAENNHNLDVDALVVKEASVGKAIVMKRFTPARAWPRLGDPEAVQPHPHRRPRTRRRRLRDQDLRSRHNGS